MLGTVFLLALHLNIGIGRLLKRSRFNTHPDSKLYLVYVLRCIWINCIVKRRDGGVEKEKSEMDGSSGQHWMRKSKKEASVTFCNYPLFNHIFYAVLFVLWKKYRKYINRIFDIPSTVTVIQSAFHLLPEDERICITAAAAIGPEPWEARCDFKPQGVLLIRCFKRILHNNSVFVWCLRLWLIFKAIKACHLNKD